MSMMGRREATWAGRVGAVRPEDEDGDVMAGESVIRRDEMAASRARHDVAQGRVPGQQRPAHSVQRRELVCSSTAYRRDQRGLPAPSLFHAYKPRRRRRLDRTPESPPRGPILEMTSFEDK